MNAFILAAGVSRRLYPHTYNIPKCLLKVNGKPIINYQLEALEDLNIKKVTMILGYHREMIKDHVKKEFPKLNFKFLVNHHYFETNTAYSVYVGINSFNSEQILMNADVVYPKELLDIVLNSKFDTVLAVDVKQCGREEVKVIDGGLNKIVAIGKDLIENHCLGEFIGVAKISKKFSMLFADSISKLIHAGGKNDYFEAGIQPLLNKVDIHYVDISKFPCMEIDFIEDLELAQKIFIKEI